MYSQKSVAPEVSNPKDWSPQSWKQFPVKQLPTYPDQAALEQAYNELQNNPPLITSWEVEALKKKLANVSAGNSF